MTGNSLQENSRPMTRLFRLGSVFAIALVYFFSNPSPQNYYDYPFRVAGNLIRGEIGFVDKPPSWLNEFVPFDGLWYSVFPFGSVVSMLPFAVLQRIGLIEKMPSALMAALCAGASGYFLLKLAGLYDWNRWRSLFFAVSFLFGTFVWTNTVLGGAWQLSLGFALAGQLGAIWFLIGNRSPFWSGLMFAVAFGNRTEVLLAAPVMFFLLLKFTADNDDGTERNFVKEVARPLALFAAIPFVLGIATLVYNYVRFASISDFGHARIPGVLDEPWYRYGIFSAQYLWPNCYEMLLRPWITSATFPYLKPDAFGAAITWSSPFLLLALRTGAQRSFIKWSCWTAVVLLTFVLWIHGNAGGYQFSYRYATILLPWIAVIMLENSDRRAVWYETFLGVFSIIINAYATWLFVYTDYTKT